METALGKTKFFKYLKHTSCGCTEKAREGLVGKRVSQVEGSLW